MPTSHSDPVVLAITYEQVSPTLIWEAKVRKPTADPSNGIVPVPIIVEDSFTLSAVI